MRLDEFAMGSLSTKLVTQATDLWLSEIGHTIWEFPFRRVRGEIFRLKVDLDDLRNLGFPYFGRGNLKDTML